MELLLAAIEFPQIDPVIVRVGPLALRWYGVAYVSGFVLGYLLMLRLAQRGVVRISTELLGELVGWIVIGVLVGGRTGWWLFYHRGPRTTWYEPLAVWEGGMSFHGGLVGVAIMLLAWSWWRRADFWSLVDGLALVVPVGLFFGRIANFINQELVGRRTDVPWAVIFPAKDTAPRHPSQLYEAVLEGPVLMAVLWVALRWRRREGQLGALFLIGYGLFRFLVEFTREPDDQIGFVAFGWLTMGQLLSVLLLVAGVVLLVVKSLSRRSAVPNERPMQNVEQ
jgi:phosphatidylglycerol---prolipoprotein diacylglyceryl transferase